MPPSLCAHRHGAVGDPQAAFSWSWPEPKRPMDEDRPQSSRPTATASNSPPAAGAAPRTACAIRHVGRWSRASAERDGRRVPSSHRRQRPRPWAGQTPSTRPAGHGHRSRANSGEGAWADASLGRVDYWERVLWSASLGRWPSDERPNKRKNSTRVRGYARTLISSPGLAVQGLVG